MEIAQIPDIRITLPNGNICDLRRDLAALNWAWEHPRIQIFLNRCADRYLVLRFTPENIPYKVLSRLALFINIIWQCEQTIKVLGIDWRDKGIVTIFAQYGGNAEMSLEGWELLLKHLDKRWFEAGGGF